MLFVSQDSQQHINNLVTLPLVKIKIKKTLKRD